MTTVGGIGHTLPFLISDFFYAMCVAAAFGGLSGHRGRVLVFIVGILIGSA
jgi:hypothetical protein